MAPLRLFIVYPALALLPAAAFALLASRARSRLAWCTAALWALYAGYETAMARRLLCSGECNIRVDLLLLYPALGLLSLATVIVAVRRRRA
jgi:hypothetical protein